MVNYDTLMHSVPNATYFIPESYSYRNDRAGLPTIIFTVWQATVTKRNQQHQHYRNCKEPYLQIGTESIMTQPGIHTEPGNGQRNDYRYQDQLEKPLPS